MNETLLTIAKVNGEADRVNDKVKELLSNISFHIFCEFPDLKKGCAEYHFEWAYNTEKYDGYAISLFWYHNELVRITQKGVVCFFDCVKNDQTMNLVLYINDIYGKV